MSELLSADHIAAQAGAFEPQRRNNFTLYLDVGGKIIQQAMQSFPLPKEANEPIVVNYGNEQRKVAGRTTITQLELVIKDYADQPGMKEIVAWRRKVWDPNSGAISLASVYKKTGRVVMFAPDGSTQREWKLYGIWPSNLDPGAGSMEDNVQNTVTVTLQVDKAIEQTL